MQIIEFFTLQDRSVWVEIESIESIGEYSETSTVVQTKTGATHLVNERAIDVVNRLNRLSQGR